MSTRTVRFSNAQGLGLNGLVYSVGSPSIVVLVHGLASDQLSKGRFPKLAAKLNAAGIDALAFDCAGCGDSDDATLTWDGLESDVRAAVRDVKTAGYKKVGLFGHSLGGTLALRAWSKEVAAIAATGAATDAIEYDWVALYGAERMRAAEELGCVTLGDGGQRRVKIDRTMLEGFATIDGQAMLSRVKCPVLLVHGDSESDAEERLLLERSRKNVSLLPEGSQLEVIRGAGHAMLEQWDDVATTVSAWLSLKLT